MPRVSANEAARRFADLIDAVEHRGERFTIVRRGRPIAHLGPIPSGSGADAKAVLQQHRRDLDWSKELAFLRRAADANVDRARLE